MHFPILYTNILIGSGSPWIDLTRGSVAARASQLSVEAPHLLDAALLVQDNVDAIGNEIARPHDSVPHTAQTSRFAVDGDVVALQVRLRFLQRLALQHLLGLGDGQWLSFSRGLRHRSKGKAEKK
eukprot:GGOE01047772.1.p1 GENE.GGOE01047772.1~~GGOE01047772.1.p1  ORF type:complete len:125 (-),score=11.04 GGOE01047772.1:9-383(-)